MARKYLVPIKRLGLAALIVFLFGLGFSAARDAIFSEEQRSGVLVYAIPFIAYFVTFLLLFILGIVLLAIRFNGKIPTRVYSPIEMTIIAGILVGIFCLFQPWQIVSFRYGFLLLLISLFSFIAWSHIIPRSAKLDVQLPPFTPSQHVIGLIVALVIVIVQTAALAGAASPQPPFGMRQRQWDSLNEERKAEIIAQATANFYSAEIPFFVIVSLFPAAIAYFAVREIAASAGRNGRQASSASSQTIPAPGGG